jgi:hypothetical protein
MELSFYCFITQHLLLFSLSLSHSTLKRHNITMMLYCRAHLGLVLVVAVLIVVSAMVSATMVQRPSVSGAVALVIDDDFDVPTSYAAITDGKCHRFDAASMLTRSQCSAVVSWTRVFVPTQTTIEVSTICKSSQVHACMHGD